MAEFDPLAEMNSSQQPIPSAPKPQPFGLKERMVSTLLFDTQPKRREAFVNKLGYDLNPKDDNMIKPIGAPDDQYFPIDPGGMFNWKQYIKSEGGDGSEIMKDAAEAFADATQGGMTEAGGVGGAILGAAGGPIGAIAGRAAGRATMFNAIEKMKDSMGDLFLDKDVPIDTALRATQTAVQAVAPEVLAKGGSALKQAASKTASAVSSGVRNLLSIGDGKIGAQAWDALKKNPEMFANENALRNASSGIDNTVDKIIGAGPDGNSINNSVFAKPLADQEAQRKVQAGILSQDPNMGMAKKDLLNLFEQKKMELADPNKFPIQSQSRLDGIKYIDKQIKALKTYPGEQLSFGQLDQTVKELQNDLYTPALLTKDWRGAVKSIVDGSENSPGLNNILKQKAQSVGSPYAALKQKESQIFKAYDGVVNNVDPKKARRFIVGDELLDPTGTGTDTVAKEFGQAIKQADNVLGTNLYEGLRTGQIQNQFWQGINSKGSRGSGGSLIPSLAAAGAVGSAVTHKTGSAALGTLAGSAAGAGTYALTQPRLGTSVAIGAENLANKIGSAGPSEALGNFAGQLASQEAIQKLPSQQEAPQNQEFDPLNDFDPLKDFKK